MSLVKKSGLGPEKNFLGIEDENLYSYEQAKYVIQSAPYEYTSSYLAGSARGPEAILEASHFVEFYDEAVDFEAYHAGIATLAAMSFENKVDAEAVDIIEENTTALLNDDKFVISLGAEHTVTSGFVRAYAKKFNDLSVLQLDAHSDLREAYQGNKYSHASVMARVKELGLKITQIGIRAQEKAEAEVIRASPHINTFYAYQIRSNNNWMQEAVETLSDNVYITIDADGFDPSVIPAVGTAEPGGLYWQETLDFLKMVCREKNVVGFDVVEVAPIEGQIISEFVLAKLVYKIIGFIETNK
ncbi:MAG: agmatinase [Bacteroidia bacterium]